MTRYPYRTPHLVIAAALRVCRQTFMRWLHRVTADGSDRPVLTASVIAEPNRACTFSFVVLLADDTLKSITGYSTEKAAKAAGVEWVKRIGHKVGSTGRTSISIGGA